MLTTTIRTCRALLSDKLQIAMANVVLALPSRRLRRQLVTRGLGWSLGEDVWIGRRLRILTRGGVTIGSRVVIHRRAEIDGRGTVSIGDDVALAPGVTILTADHDPDSPTREYRERAVTIGSRVWLATGAIVLPGASVGEGVVVGAGGVAHGKLEPWTIYAGNPAVPVRSRHPDAQQRLDAYLPRWI